MSLSLENSYKQPIHDPSFIAERRIAHRTSKEKKKLLRTAAAGVMAGSLLVAGAIKFGPRAVGSFEHVQRQQDAYTLHRRETYGGKFKMPTAEAEHRALIVGDEVDGIAMMNVGSIAQVINKENPGISTGEAEDLIEAQISQAQLADGVKPEDVDPFLVRPAEEIMLPMGYEVGKVIPAGEETP